LVLSLTRAFNTSKDHQIPKLDKRKRAPPPPLTRKAKGAAQIQFDDLLDDEQSFDFESSCTDSDEEHSSLIRWSTCVSFQHGFGADDGVDLH
jgi:hypothetical protein